MGASPGRPNYWGRVRITLRRNRHHLFQLILDRAARLAQLVFVLQPHPELHGGSKYFGKAQGGVRRDAALAQHDLVDAARRHADGVGESGLADLHREQKLFEEDFAGVNVL